ncbi:MAG: hypothetical protein R3B97_00290 [Dehalococcoidia bacterium]|nr:hypothetical protein [Thermoflexaceae bacterium]
MKHLLALLAFAIAVSLPLVYQPAPANACGPAGPFDFDTYEVEDYVSGYAQAIELATSGRAVTSTITLPGTNEVIDLRFQGLRQGPRGARAANPSTSATIPPTLYKSIVYVESSYTNASSATPFGGVGPILRSFDCGYGLGQITSGMTNSVGSPTAKQAIIGTHYLFNLAEGVRILAEKWNSAPQARPIAGTGDPSALEDWYYAIWSYNGFAFSNHPLNPFRNPLRGGLFNDADTGGATPTATPTATAPAGTPTATPSITATPTPTPNAIVGAGARSPLYHCYDTSAPSYQKQDGGGPLFGYGDYTYPERIYGCMRYPPRRAPVGSPPGTPATISFWAPVEVSMPDFARPEVAAAFEPQNFLDCEQAGFSGGCPKMDFPTSFPPAVVAHRDPTPLPPASASAVAVGSPSLVVDGSTAITLGQKSDGTYDTAEVSVRNAGSWIAPFRIRSTATWLSVRHPGDSPDRTLDGSIAIGVETDVVTQQASPGPPPRTRIAVKGKASQLLIAVQPSLVPAGGGEASIWIEPLLGGEPIELKVTLDGTVVAARPFQLFLPWISSEPND